jgi:hypothetical protein
VCNVILIRNELLKIYTCLKENKYSISLQFSVCSLKGNVMKSNLLAINNKEVCLLSSVCKKIKEVTCEITAQNIA